MDRRATLLRMAPLLRPAATAKGLALALIAASLLAACSVDSALRLDDVSSVGSITPPAPVGSAFAYNEPRNVTPAPSAMSAAAFPAAMQDHAAPASWDAPDQQISAAPTDDAPLPPASSNTVSVMDTERVVEGDTRDPVVAGIGTGHPVEVESGHPTTVTMSDGNGHVTEIYTGPPGRGAPPQPLSLPPGASEAQIGARPDGAPADGAVKLAALPRPASPMPQASDAEPEPAIAPPPAPAPQGVAPAPQSSWSSQDSTGGMPASEIACRRELNRLGVTYTDIPRISDGPACGIAWPIKVTALSGDIRIKPAATLNCQVTAEFAKWVKNDAAPAARTRYFSGIRNITQLSSYSCRTMNSQAGAPMSEHAHGNAIDIGAITLNSGRRIDVRKPGWFAFRQRGFLNTVRAESCNNFTTVLGPGTNKYHWNHFHFDLRHRKSGRSYCE
ncbi:MAG TPA: extensin family protein [Pararhizobium sp.]|nr:extensin family protein [Pararhizobium sp.]